MATGKRRRKTKKTSGVRRKRHKQPKPLPKEASQNIKFLILSFGVVMMIVTVSIFMTTTFGKMEGYSMMPVINDKDIFSINKVSSVARFDVIYLKVPNKKSAKSVRRVIGMPGDELNYKNDQLTINNQEKSEKYLNNRKNSLLGGVLTNDFTLKDLTGQQKVPQGKYFVMGDNRQSSADSRDYGFIDKSQIVGKVELTVLPLSHLKNIR